jgi:hypothetical protein
LKETEDRGPASPLRRRAIETLLALGGFAALGFAFESSRSRRTADRSAWLRVHEHVGSPGNPGEPPALWLALATLSPSRRSAILDEIEAALASVEARLNPLLVDLVEDDVVDVVRRNQRWLLPLCTAASAVLARGYEAPDGFRVEALAVDAPRKPGDVRAWQTQREDARERRARFLAWPVSRSVIVRDRFKGGAHQVEIALRDASARPESAVALVLDRRLLYGASPEPRLEAVLARLMKAGRRIQGENDLPFVPNTPAPGACLVPWVALEDDELLVVPKLAAASPARRFEIEIQRLLGTDSELVATNGD